MEVGDTARITIGKCGECGSRMRRRITCGGAASLAGKGDGICVIITKGLTWTEDFKFAK